LLSLLNLIKYSVFLLVVTFLLVFGGFLGGVIGWLVLCLGFFGCVLRCFGKVWFSCVDFFAGLFGVCGGLFCLVCLLLFLDLQFFSLSFTVRKFGEVLSQALFHWEWSLSDDVDDLWEVDALLLEEFFSKGFDEVLLLRE